MLEVLRLPGVTRGRQLTPLGPPISYINSQSTTPLCELHKRQLLFSIPKRPTSQRGRKNAKPSALSFRQRGRYESPGVPCFRKEDLRPQGVLQPPPAENNNNNNNKNLLLSNKGNTVVSWLTYFLQAGTCPSQGQLGYQSLNHGATQALMTKSMGPPCWVSVVAVACGSM